MKTNFDHSYEKALNNGLKKRRALAVLTVLSMIVTSGVMWGLRDTGVTMVNEPVCILEEHEHNEDCYQEILVCGMEENEEHTHSEECFETALVCTLSEHIHGMGCDFSEEEFEEPAQEDYPVVELGELNEEEELDYDGELPTFTASSGVEVLANGEDPHPTPTNRFDNTIDGIKINFYDYGTELLDYGEYRVSADESDDAYVNHFKKPKEAGINGLTGFEESVYNSYDNDEAKLAYINNFLLFFSYGTPADGGKDGITNPGINNYSGDYNQTPAVSGNRPVQGIVAPVLEPNGKYPLLNGKTWGIGHLFLTSNDMGTDENDPIRKCYKNVTHLMYKDPKTGRYSYYSDQNYAYLETEGNYTSADGEPSDGRFTVYDQTYYIYEGANKDHNNRPIGFFPFDKYPTTYDRTEDGIDIYKDGGEKNYLYGDPTHNSRVNNDYGDKQHDYNHHFGMTLEAKFTMSRDSNYQYKGQDIEFSYSGDDDMWVFVDDILVLDLGGIHEPAAGQVNFTKGYVLVQDNAYGKYNEDQLNDPINSGIPAEYGTDLLTGEILTNYMRGLKGRNDSGSGNVKMNVFDLKNLYNENASKGNELITGGLDKTWDPDAEHTIKIFYLERGGSYSNLAMEFCLPFTEQLNVEKKVDDESKRNELNDELFEYELYIREDGNFVPAAGKEYIINDDGTIKYTTDPNGKFTLKHGQRATFLDLSPDIQYYIKELAVDSEIFDKVEFVGNSGDSSKDNRYEELADGSGGHNVQAGCEVDANGQRYYKLSETNYVTFVNHVRYEETGLDVVKKWGDGNDKHSDNVVHFKLYRTDENGKEEVVSYKEEGKPKQRTFALKAESWTKKFVNLPVRYGNHKYTYSVKEAEVEGYQPEYTIDKTSDPIVITITNVPDNQVEIHAEKRWEGGISEDEYNNMEVKVKLRRHYIEYGNSQETKLTVNLVDQDGKSIKTEQIDVYVDGGVEFSLELPQGAEIIGDTQYVNCTRVDEDIGESFFEINEIKEGAAVTIRIDTTNVRSGYLYRASFTDGTDGWGGNGAQASVVGSALKVFGRDKDWKGASLGLTNPEKYGISVGETYKFSVWVRHFQGTDCYIKLQFNDSKYTPIGSDGGGVRVPANQWVKIEGTAIVPDNPKSISICTVGIIPNNDDSYPITDLYIDEFIIAPADAEIYSVEPTTFEEKIHDTFDDGNKLGGWGIPNHGGFYSSAVENDVGQYLGNYAKVYGINSPDDGPISPLNNVERGKTYSFQAMINWNSTESNGSYRKVKSDGSGYDYSHPDSVKFKMILQYDGGMDEIASVTANRQNWAQLNGAITIPAGANNVSVKIITDEADGWYLGEFYIDEFIVSEIGDVEQDVPVGGTYEIKANPDSITAARVKIREGDEECFDFTLSKDQGWTKFWRYGDLNVDPNCSYTYYVEELSIVYPDGSSTTITPEGESDDGNFLVTYLNNEGISSNSAEDPIVICNKYIWYKLPATGGSGTRQIYVFGAVLIAIGTTSIIINYRRKRRAG